MSIYKSLLRWWMTLASLVGFVVGWVTLGHASETKISAANSASTQPAETALPTVPALDSLLGDSPQLTPVQTYTIVTPIPTAVPTTAPVIQYFQPILRTRGS